MRFGMLVFLGWIAAGGLAAQTPPQTPLPANDPGRKSFEARCGPCHGGDGNGGEMGPAITGRLVSRDDTQLTALIHTGIPASGMPGNKVEGPELAALVRFLRSIQSRRGDRPLVRMTVETTDGKKLDGLALNEGFDDLQLRTDDNRIHLLRRAGGRFREVTSESDWPEYNGDPRGNRYTTLSGITKSNVARLAPRRWWCKA
jgi:alcohol dehydrogenase (cytochrome c)